MKEVARGVSLSEVAGSNLVPYPDLARGMVMMAEEGGGTKWAGKKLGIVVSGEKEMHADMRPLFVYLVLGLLANWFPRVWAFGRRCGWW